MSNYVKVPDGFNFSTKFPTWIIAFCPDSDSWFVTNNRFFYYEYDKDFETEEEGIEFFRNNPNIFYDAEIMMGINRPHFNNGGVYLENVKALISLEGEKYENHI